MRKFKLNIDGSERLLGFKAALFSNKHKVFLDGQQIGEFHSGKEAKEGKEFKIDDNNFINIRYVNVGLTPEVHVVLNGQVLEDSVNHPKARKNAVFGLIILLAVLNLGIGAVGVSNSVEAVTNGGYGIYNLVLGIFYLLALSFFKISNPFLGIFLALILYSIDSIMVLMTIPHNPGLSGAIIVRIIFFTILIQGMKATWPEFRNVFGKA